ncbi:hypothetical protein GCM10010472_04100 [Pseudonocardia halophobica]|uniref:HNH nuclease domain-containing protein n=1 Tax=Pseudonocardia halophobica TaxID=29401 RepID=A0A9W6L6Y0_9PSEU|nr:HNH endonuclease signature motif containing protein [Pseudonocardia halophobica]GLL13369.1 hypothetical protein GCM10017577_45120 [Pseudonocardia halophobica]
MGTSRGPRGPYKGKSSYSATTARGYGADWQKIRKFVLERDGHRCGYCGQPANTVDHIVPKVRGGTDDPQNLRAACDHCNYSKADRAAPASRPSTTRPAGQPRLAGWYTPHGLRVSRKWADDVQWYDGDEAA